MKKGFGHYEEPEVEAIEEAVEVIEDAVEAETVADEPEVIPVEEEVEEIVEETVETDALLEVAKEVLAGKYGSGARRERLLREKGYDPAEVQKAVSKIAP